MLAALIRSLLPCHCVLCGAAGPALLCQGCHAQCFSAQAARCPVCANPLPPGADGMPCARCLAACPDFDATVVAADYALPVDSLVLQLKFGGRLAHARLFADLLAMAVQGAPQLARPALLCPVPLGLERLAERGFNQALEIARPLGKTLGIAVLPQLAWRVQETAAQSSMPHGARQANIAHAFAIPDRALVDGRHIGVVDDVMSSGHTLQELAATLKRHGAARVTNYVFARTPPQHT